MVENTPLAIRAFMRAYPWRRIDPVPFAPLAKPLAESRVALVSSAAQVLEGQQLFDDEAKGGDCTFREIPSDSSCSWSRSHSGSPSASRTTARCSAG